jgi:hypothetical protein
MTLDRRTLGTAPGGSRDQGSGVRGGTIARRGRPARRADRASPGEPAFPALLAALARLDTDLFSVVEQDLHPVEPHIPLPTGARTAGYLRGRGLGPVRRWPYLPPM